MLFFFPEISSIYLCQTSIVSTQRFHSRPLETLYVLTLIFQTACYITFSETSFILIFTSFIQERSIVFRFWHFSSHYHSLSSTPLGDLPISGHWTTRLASLTANNFPLFYSRHIEMATDISGFPPTEGDIVAYVPTQSETESETGLRIGEAGFPEPAVIVLDEMYKPPSRRNEKDTVACLLVSHPQRSFFRAIMLWPTLADV